MYDELAESTTGTSLCQVQRMTVAITGLHDQTCMHHAPRISPAYQAFIWSCEAVALVFTAQRSSDGVKLFSRSKALLREDGHLSILRNNSVQECLTLLSAWQKIALVT